MAITQPQINYWIAAAQRAQEVGVLNIVNGKRSGQKGNSLYYPMRWLSAGVDVLTSNNNLTNLQIETIVYMMIEKGNLNDFSGDPIPYLTIYVIDYSNSGQPGPPGPPGPPGTGWTSIGTIAAAGTNQATATPITTNIVYVDTVTTGTGMALPAATYNSTTLIGSYEEVYNTTSTDMLLYPLPGDAFFGMSAGTPFLITGGSSIKLRSVATGIWRIN